MCEFDSVVVLQVLISSVEEAELLLNAASRLQIQVLITKLQKVIESHSHDDVQVSAFNTHSVMQFYWD